jgi:hypothetical protein
MPQSMDADSKRWLTFLAVTAAVSVVLAAYALVKTLSSPQQSVVAPQKPTPAQTEGTTANSGLDWSTSPAGHGSEAATTRVDPFAAQDAAAAKAAAKNDPVAAQQAVHREAEYLRNLISQGKLPGSYGNLTKEQVDQMEKDGIMIN